MEVDLKDLRKMEDVMVKANFITRKVASMMDNGKTIICMAMGSSIMPTEKSPMKGLGSMTSFTGMVKCLMIILLRLRVPITIVTSKN